MPSACAPNTSCRTAPSGLFLCNSSGVSVSPAISSARRYSRSKFGPAARPCGPGRARRGQGPSGLQPAARAPRRGGVSPLPGQTGRDPGTPVGFAWRTSDESSLPNRGVLATKTTSGSPTVPTLRCAPLTVWPLQGCRRGRAGHRDLLMTLTFVRGLGGAQGPLASSRPSITSSSRVAVGEHLVAGSTFFTDAPTARLPCVR